MKLYTRFVGILVCSVLLSLTACNLPFTANAPTSTPSFSATPSVMVLPLTPTTTVIPTATSTSLPPTPTGTGLPPTIVPEAHPDTIDLKVFLIAVGDNGVAGKKIGCDDSIVPVTISVPYTTGVLRAALEQLLAIKNQYYGMSGLYDSLYQSNLKIDSLEVINGVAHIDLSGTLMLSGECDNPRVEAQLEEIALQFGTVQSTEITINGQPLADVLSLK